MLELRGLAERVDQGLPVLEAPRVGVTRPPADLQDAGERTMRDMRGGVGRGALLLDRRREPPLGARV